MKMPAHKKYEVTDEDLRLTIELVKERDRLLALANEQAEIMRDAEREMIRLRREARDLSNRSIAEKIEIGEHTVWRISNCQIMQDAIEAIDPEFYFSRARDDERFAV